MKFQSISYGKVFLVAVTGLNSWSTCARKVQNYICCPTCLPSVLNTFISSKFCALRRILYPQNETPPTPLLVNLMWTSVLQSLCAWLQLLFSPFWSARIFPSYGDYSCQWEWCMPMSHSNIVLETHLNPKDSTVRHLILNTGKFA